MREVQFFADKLLDPQLFVINNGLPSSVPMPKDSNFKRRKRKYEQVIENDEIIKPFGEKTVEVHTLKQHVSLSCHVPPSKFFHFSVLGIFQECGWGKQVSLDDLQQVSPVRPEHQKKARVDLKQT